MSSTVRKNLRMPSSILTRLEAYADKKGLNFTDATIDLCTIALQVIDGKVEGLSELIPEPRIATREVIKEVVKYVWISCQFAEIHCRKDRKFYNAQTCWDCHKGHRWERETRDKYSTEIRDEDAKDMKELMERLK